MTPPSTAPAVDSLIRLQQAAQALAGAIHSGPRRSALLARFYRVAAPVLEEREALIVQVNGGYDRINAERERLGIGYRPFVPEPDDARYQKGVDRWLTWEARFREIEDALSRAADTAGVRV